MGQAALIHAALPERDAAAHHPPCEPSLAASYTGLHLVAACRLAPCSWPNQRITLPKLVVRGGTEPPAFRFQEASRVQAVLGRARLGRPWRGRASLAGAIEQPGPVPGRTQPAVTATRHDRPPNTLDSSGSKIGALEPVYMRTATDEAIFATVTVGMAALRRLVFVPLAEATVGPGYLRSLCQGPGEGRSHIDTDGELPAASQGRGSGVWAL
jgi:hypothetical protein